MPVRDVLVSLKLVVLVVVLVFVAGGGGSVVDVVEVSEPAPPVTTKDKL